MSTMKKITTMLFTAALLVSSIVFQNPVSVNAASSNGSIYSDKQYKVGKYYYTISKEGLSMSGSKGGNGKIIVPGTTGNERYNQDAYFYGKYIYYSTEKGGSESNARQKYIYRIKRNGTNRKRLVALRTDNYETGGRVELVYGGNIYFQDSSGSEPAFYRIKISTGKVYSYNKSCLSINEKHHYKQYYVIHVEAGDFFARESFVLNAKTGKLKKISNRSWSIVSRGKKIYYIEADKKYTSMKLRQCNITTGGNKKTLAKVKGKQGASILKVTSKYCEYKDVKTSVIYRYIFSSRKTVKTLYKKGIVVAKVNGNTLKYHKSGFVSKILPDEDWENIIGYGKQKQIKIASSATFYLFDKRWKLKKVSKQQFLKKVREMHYTKAKSKRKTYYLGMAGKITIKNGKCVKFVQVYQA